MLRCVLHPCRAASSEDRLIYLLSQAQQIQELLAFLRKLSNSGLLQCVAAAAAGESVPSASQRHACHCLLPAIVRREFSPCQKTHLDNTTMCGLCEPL